MALIRTTLVFGLDLDDGKGFEIADYKVMCFLCAMIPIRKRLILVVSRLDDCRDEPVISCRLSIKYNDV